MSNYEGILEMVQGRVTELSSTMVQTQICINGYFRLVSFNVSNLLDLRNTYLTSLLLSKSKSLITILYLKSVQVHLMLKKDILLSVVC